MSTDVTDLVSSSDLEMDNDLDTERQSFRRQRWGEARAIVLTSRRLRFLGFVICLPRNEFHRNREFFELCHFVDIESGYPEMMIIWIFRTRISTATIPKNLTILEEPSDGDMQSH